MSATTAGAIKAYLETQSLGIPIYRDDAPPGQAKPYITVQEGISLTADSGDTGDHTATLYGSELAQVDLWQDKRTAGTDAVAESYPLPAALVRALHGASLTTAPTRTHGCTVDSMVRLVERDTNTVHHAITVRLRRAI